MKITIELTSEQINSILVELVKQNEQQKEYPLLQNLNVSARLYNALKNVCSIFGFDFKTARLNDLEKITCNEFLRVRNVGKGSLIELEGLLASHGLSFKK